MIIVNPNLRITKKFNSKRYTLFCPMESSEIMEIGRELSMLLRRVNDGEYESREKLRKDIPDSIISDLMYKKILIDSETYKFNQNILPELKYKYTLTSLVIELTDACNLNCVHCYGKFGQPNIKHKWNYEDILKLKKELDELHTMEVRLSGGECFMNPDFIKIAMYFLDNGFRVGVYTNGYEVSVLSEFLKQSKNYNYYVAISLDGIGDVHNDMRGRDCYDKVISSLDELYKYDNVDVLVETAVSKINLEKTDEICEFIKKRYPRFEHKAFLVSPVNGCNVSFNSNEILKLRDNYNYLFEDYYQSKIMRIFPSIKRKKFRCQGGVINGVLTADGQVKCCPLAQDEVFVMGHLIDRSLVDIWENPDGETAEFRHEYLKKSKKCKKCKSRNKCGNKNCRVEAMALTGSWRNENPYTCMTVKGYYQEEKNEELFENC